MNNKSISKKTQARCEQLYKIGLEMFLENGYEKTSLSDIVKKSGGSLSTIYQNFGNKESFFEAVVFKGIEEFYDNLEKKLKQEKDQSLENFLYQFGIEYINIFTNEKNITIGKIVYREGHLGSGIIVKNFKKRINSIVNKLFYEYFEANNIKRILKYDDYDMMINQFCLLLREPEFTEYILIGKLSELTCKQKQEKVKRVVDFFLNGYKKS